MKRDAAGITIDWWFRPDHAGTKRHLLYPCLSNLD